MKPVFEIIMLKRSGSLPHAGINSGNWNWIITISSFANTKMPLGPVLIFATTSPAMTGFAEIVLIEICLISHVWWGWRWTLCQPVVICCRISKGKNERFHLAIERYRDDDWIGWQCRGSGSCILYLIRRTSRTTLGFIFDSMQNKTNKRERHL